MDLMKSWLILCTFATIVFAKKCRDVPAKSSFDPEQVDPLPPFKGVWYVQGHLNDTIDAVTFCNSATFAGQTGTIQTVELKQKVIGIPLTSNGNVTMSDPSVGAMAIKFDNLKEKTYKVVDTVYNDWAVVYMCKKVKILKFQIVQAWVLNRTAPNMLNNNWKPEVLEAFDKTGIDRSKLAPTFHKWCRY